MPSEERDAERCPVAAENTDGAYYCTRKRGHDGPCAAVPTERERIRQDLSETVTTAIHKTMERDAEMLGDSGSVDYYVRQLEDALRQRNAECRALRSEKAAMVEVVEAARRVDAGAPESLLERLELSIVLAGLDAAEGGA